MHVRLLYSNFIEVTADSAQNTSSDRHVIDRIFHLSKFTPTHCLLSGQFYIILASITRTMFSARDESKKKKAPYWSTKNWIYFKSTVSPAVYFFSTPVQLYRPSLCINQTLTFFDFPYKAIRSRLQYRGIPLYRHRLLKPFKTDGFVCPNVKIMIFFVCTWR